MIGTLLRIRLAGLSHSLSYGAKGKATRIAMAAALLMAAISVGSSAYLFFDALAAPFYEAGIGSVYFSLFLLFALTIMLLSSLFIAKAELYEAKDNELLLSLPIRPSAILWSRLLTLIAANFLVQLPAAVPAAICWVRDCPVTPLGCFAFLLTCLLLPLTVTAIAALLGWLVSLLTVRIRRKSLFTTVLVLGFLTLYFCFYPKLMAAIMDPFTTGTALADNITGILPLQVLSRAMAEGSLTDLLLSLPILLLPFLLAVRVLSVTYLRTLTANRGFQKAVYREKEAKKSSAFCAIYRRELAGLLSSSAYLMNCALGVFVSILAAGFLLVKGSGLIGEYLPMLQSFGFSGERLTATLVAVLCFFGTMICTTAPSVSIERDTLWLSRSLPVPTVLLFRAKIGLHLSLACPTTLLLQIILLALLKPSLPECLLLLAVPQSFHVLLAQLGLAANLLLPNLNWTNEIAAVKNSVSCLIAIFGGWLLAAIPAILLFAVDSLPVLPVLVGELTVLLLGNLFLARWLKVSGVHRYQTL